MKGLNTCLSKFHNITQNICPYVHRYFPQEQQQEEQAIISLQPQDVNVRQKVHFTPHSRIPSQCRQVLHKLLLRGRPLLAAGEALVGASHVEPSARLTHCRQLAAKVPQPSGHSLVRVYCSTRSSGGEGGTAHGEVGTPPTPCGVRSLSFHLCQRLQRGLKVVEQARGGLITRLFASEAPRHGSRMEHNDSSA